jgi:hypothetical protein
VLCERPELDPRFEQAELDRLDQGSTQALAEQKDFKPVERTMMRFDEFVQATKEHVSRAKAGAAGEPPYLTTDLLWRNSMDDNGNIQNIGEQLKADLMGGGINFLALKSMMDAHQLPLMKQVHLFIGSARTLCTCPPPHAQLLMPNSSCPPPHAQLPTHAHLLMRDPTPHAGSMSAACS